jgi:hypothetical protein
MHGRFDCELIEVPVRTTLQAMTIVYWIVTALFCL